MQLLQRPAAAHGVQLHRDAHRVLLARDLDPLEGSRDVPPEGLAHARIGSAGTCGEAQPDTQQDCGAPQYALHGIPNQQSTRAS